MNERPVQGSGWRLRNVDLWVCSDLSSFRQFEGIFHVDPEIAYRAVNLGVAEQDLDSPKIARRFVNDRRLCSSERVGTVIVGLEADANYPRNAAAEWCLAIPNVEVTTRWN